MMNYVECKDLKARLRKGEAALPVKKAYFSVNEPVADRQIKFTISTPAKDRDNDIIMQDGWQLDNYLGNPVVLLNHRSSDLPIAKCVAIGVEDGNLKATVEFVPSHIPGIGDTAEAVYQLCQHGFMSATSVGFRPIQWDWDDDSADGIVFSKQELLEFSIVSVPSNPEALIQPAASVVAMPPVQSNALNIATKILKLRLRTLQLLDT